MARHDEYDDDRVVVIERERDSSGSIAMLLFGIAVGAGAALLMAPASGEETRERIRSEARRARQRVREMTDELGDQLADRVERTRDVVDRNFGTARERVSERARAVTEAVEAGREAAHQAKGELERAVSETKRAYQDSRRNLRSTRVAHDRAVNDRESPTEPTTADDLTSEG